TARWVTRGASQLGRALERPRGVRPAAKHEARLAAGRPGGAAHDLASAARVEGGRPLRLPRSAADVSPVAGGRRAVSVPGDVRLRVGDAPGVGPARVAHRETRPRSGEQKREPENPPNDLSHSGSLLARWPAPLPSATGRTSLGPHRRAVNTPWW